MSNSGIIAWPQRAMGWGCKGCAHEKASESLKGGRFSSSGQRLTKLGRRGVWH